MSTETFISSHLSSTTAKCQLKLLSALTCLQPQPNVNWNFYQLSPVFSHTAKCHLKRYQLSPAFNHTAKCHQKFMSVFVPLQQASRTTNEIRAIIPCRTWTPAEADDRPTAQCRANFISAPNSLQPNSRMPSEIYISPEQPSTPQPKTERSSSVPNSLQPLSATKPTLVLNSLQPSNLCLSQSFQPHSHKAYHSPE